MLESLKIKNLALIKEEHINFKEGLNVILGETGSGKSLIFDAISFVLGQSNDKTLLRSNSEVMKVDAIFSNLSSSSKAILNSYGIESDEVLLTRIFTKEGKSTYKINGESAVASMIKNLSKTLIDSLVQHESIELLKSKNHLIMLDKFGGEKLLKIKEALVTLLNEKKEIEKKIKNLGGNSFERERNRDIYLFQLNEIENADLREGEEEEIKDRLNILSNAEKICEAISIADINLSNGSNSALNQINEVISHLNSLDSIESIKGYNERLVSLRYELEDIADSLMDTRKSVSFDEIEYNKLDARLDTIKALKKKYGGSIEKILAYANELHEKINEIENSEELLNDLNSKLEKISKKLDEIASELSHARSIIAKEIENKVIKELVDLGMKNTSFKVQFKEKEVCSDGKDDVEFTFSANKGQDLKNLAKTASGGEASRIMLALKNIFSNIDDTGCLLFDEVDSGISGEVGNMVGKKLLSISKNSQVICITHLPQVVALADNFYLVEKKVVNDETISNTTQIDEEKVISEIARLIGGNNITDIAIKHAIEMRGRK